MPFDPVLADRLRRVLAHRDLVEKRMFGGLALMQGDAMGVGIIEDRLVVRATPERAAELAATVPGVRPMDFTGRPMKGWLYVEGPAIADDEDLRRWAEASLAHVAALPPKKRKKKGARRKPPSE